MAFERIKSWFREFSAAPRESTSRFLSAEQLPGDAATLLEAGLIEPWRTSADGVAWYKADIGDIEAIAAAAAIQACDDDTDQAGDDGDDLYVDGDEFDGSDFDGT